MVKYRECSRMRAARELGFLHAIPAPTHLYSHELIGIQPMSLPCGTLFFLDKYGTDIPSQPRREAAGEGQSHEEAGSPTGSNVEIRSESTADPHSDSSSGRKA